MTAFYCPTPAGDTLDHIQLIATAISMESDVTISQISPPEEGDINALVAQLPVSVTAEFTFG